MTTNVFPTWALAALICPCLHFICAADEYRIWTSTSGSTIEAIMISNGTSGIQLKTREGRIFNLQASQLSSEDRRFLEEKAIKGTGPEILGLEEDNSAWYAGIKPRTGEFLMEAMLKSKARANFAFTSPVESGPLILHLVYEEEESLVEYARQNREGILMLTPRNDGNFAEEMLTGKSSARPVSVQNGKVRFTLENKTTIPTKIAFWLEKR